MHERVSDMYELQFTSLEFSVVPFVAGRGIPVDIFRSC